MTQPNCERLAERSITELHYSYEPWLPTRKALIRGVRFDGSGRRIRSRGDSIVERPLFKGYLLLPLPWNDDGYEVEEAAGVLRIVRYPVNPSTMQRKPKVIRASIIEAIKTAVEAGEFDDPANPQSVVMG